MNDQDREYIDIMIDELLVGIGKSSRSGSTPQGNNSADSIRTKAKYPRTCEHEFKFNPRIGVYICNNCDYRVREDKWVEWCLDHEYTMAERIDPEGEHKYAKRTDRVKKALNRLMSEREAERAERIDPVGEKEYAGEQEDEKYEEHIEELKATIVSYKKLLAESERLHRVLNRECLRLGNRLAEAEDYIAKLEGRER